MGGSDGGGGRHGGRQSAGRRPAPAVGRTASHPPAPPAERAQEIPNAQARAGIPCRAGAQAQRKPSTARAASHPTAPPASRPQEIPNARAREDTTTRRPARNSKRARARYWRRGSRPLRVRRWRRVSFSWHHENGQRESGTTMPRREIEKRNCLQSVGSSAIILSVPNRR